MRVLLSSANVIDDYHSFKKVTGIKNPKYYDFYFFSKMDMTKNFFKYENEVLRFCMDVLNSILHKTSKN